LYENTLYYKLRQGLLGYIRVIEALHGFGHFSDMEVLPVGEAKAGNINKDLKGPKCIRWWILAWPVPIPSDYWWYGGGGGGYIRPETAACSRTARLLETHLDRFRTSMTLNSGRVSAQDFGNISIWPILYGVHVK